MPVASRRARRQAAIVAIGDRSAIRSSARSQAGTDTCAGAGDAGEMHVASVHLDNLAANLRPSRGESDGFVVKPRSNVCERPKGCRYRDTGMVVNSRPLFHLRAVRSRPRGDRLGGVVTMFKSTRYGNQRLDGAGRSRCPPIDPATSNAARGKPGCDVPISTVPDSARIGDHQAFGTSSPADLRRVRAAGGRCSGCCPQVAAIRASRGRAASRGPLCEIHQRRLLGRGSLPSAPRVVPLEDLTGSGGRNARQAFLRRNIGLDSLVMA